MQQRVGGKQIRVRRFGWSDAGQAEAQSSAEARVREAFDRIAAGEKFARREPKIPYNGAAGVPIREEIVGRHGDAVVTRNGYGARCLNTPNVLFADVDFAAGPSSGRYFWVGVTLLLAAAVLGWTQRSWGAGLGGAALAQLLLRPFAGGLHVLTLRVAGDEERRSRGRIEQFALTHPDWHLRLYRTPAGYRVLAMHRTFDPGEPAVAECFQALGADPVYARMCSNQRCFRARVSPKPWRVGIGAHMRPRPGVWPVRPERLPERARWIDEYERAAHNHAACRFVAALGAAAVDPAAAAVQAVHDELCRATGGLPIA